MFTSRDFGRRALACLLAVTIVFSTVPPLAAQDRILGTVIVSGTAFTSTATTEWVKIEGTRPLVSGDRLKTGKESGLVADFSKLGIVGLYDDTEVWVIDRGADIAVKAQRGKVAFYLAPNSRLKLSAGSAVIAAGAKKAEGYVEFNRHGAPELVVESDDVNVVVAGGAVKVFTRGNRVVLNDALVQVQTPASAQAPAQAPVKVETAEQKPAAQPATKKRKGLSPLAWTAIAGAVVAVGVGAGVAAAGGGGGGGGDNNGSE